MPPKGRRTPELLGPDGVAGPAIDPIDEAEQASQDEPGAELAAGSQLMFDGELLQTSMTLAVVLPGDSKESYFGARAVLRCQPGEGAEDVAGRAVTIVREAVIGQMDDAIDALQEYQQQLLASGRVPSRQ